MRALARVVLLAAVPAVGTAAVGGVNHVNLQAPMNEVLASDPRNDGIDVWCHYGSFVSAGELVFDLRDVASERSQADVFRVLLQFARAVKESEFKTVHLQYRGESRFHLEGDYFRLLGEEYGTQNPGYTMRTFPQNLRLLDGSAAYGTWTGGLLGVTGRQMEDFGAFHRTWYLSDMLAAPPR